MYEDYIVDNKDIKWVEKAIQLAMSSKLKKIFPRDELENADVLLFDSKNLYIFSHKEYSNLKKVTELKNNLNLYKWKHQQKLDDSCYRGCGGNKIKGVDKNLSHHNYFFCSPLTCFIEMQKRIKRPGTNPFTTKEGYLFTIIHEYGHAYFSEHNKLDDKIKDLLEKSKRSWRDNKEGIQKLPIPFGHLSELFATLCEITAAKILESKYYDDVRKMVLEIIKTRGLHHLLGEEHVYSYVLANLYANENPDWNEKILDYF